MEIEFRRSQIEIRKREVSELLDDISRPGFMKETLSFSETAAFDFDRLIMSGHSFGGMTAIEMAHSDSRCKALFGIDPWLWVRHEQITKNEF